MITKGIKLNANGDDRSYILNTFHYDSKEKELLVVGKSLYQATVRYRNKKLCVYRFK